MRRRDGGNYFYKNMKRRTSKRRKEQHRQWAMNQGWERREQRVNLLRSRCFVVLFFSADIVNMEGAGSDFFIGHMPLHNDLWMQALCSLILLSTHYVAQPSVAIWGREEASPPHSPLPSILSTALSPIMPLSVYTFSSQLLPLSIPPTLTESLLKMV